jgi:alpha-maltose-1-phosphate synthase
MKKRVALVRGPGLNSWETQMYSPFSDVYDIVGLISQSQYFDITTVPFEVRRLFSLGRFLRARVFRMPMVGLLGDYHDLQGLKHVLRDFDLVHCLDPMYYHTYQTARAKKGANFKLVLSVWENIPFLHHNRAAAKHKEVIFDQADLLLPVSERAKEVLILEGAPTEKINVLMPGIDITHFRPMHKDPDLIRKFNCQNDDLIILYVANLYREKGIFDLLYAFRALLDRWRAGKRLRLLIAGKGREKESVSSWIRRLHLQDHALLIGTYSYEIMPKIHNLADVFVLPSIPIRTWQEQFGYVMVESMACGKPVVSTWSGSIPEVVGDAGILVQPNDFVSIEQALEQLLLDEHLREACGMRARLRAENLFDAQKVSKKLRAVYDRLLQQGEQP